MSTRIPERGLDTMATMAGASRNANAAATKPAAKQANNKIPAAAQSQPAKPATVVNLGQSKQAPALGLYDKKGAVASPAAAPSAPAAQKSGGFVADGGQVTVDIKASDSGYENKIYWSTDNFATKNYLGIDNQTGTFNLGTIAKGTRIDFGIDNGQGEFFRTGGATANFDSLDHTTQTVTKEGTQIGFEDLAGGGDWDYNDAIISVLTTPAAPAAKTAKTTPANDNRSGLGDGTNPGQGAGKTNSSNQGTLNPNSAGTTVLPTTENSKPVKKAATPAAAAPIAPVLTGENIAPTQSKKSVAATSVTASIAKTLAETGPSNTKAVTQKPVQPAAAKNTANTTTNRSGLADATNPGQGAGRANASNQGTLNPNQARTSLHLIA